MMTHNTRAIRTILILSAAMVLVFAGCDTAPPPPEQAAVEAPAWPELEGYEAMAVPADNPMTQEKVELGKQLYYDPRLSGDGVRSCYGCHLKENGLTDGKPLAIGAFDKTLTRSSPSLWNIGYHSEFYWDGRSGALPRHRLSVRGAGLRRHR